MNEAVKKEKIEVLNSLKEELEYYKKKELLSVIFFDGNDRSKINFYRDKKKEIEKMIKEIESYEV